MTTVQLLIVCITVLLLAGIVVSRRSSANAEVVSGLTTVGRETVLQVGDGQSVLGVVIGEGPGIVTLEEAVLTSDGKDTKMGGIVRVPTRVVVMAQEVRSIAPLARDEASG